MEQEQHNTGPIVGIIIIVLILVLGGIYYAGKTRPADTGLPTADEIRTQEDAAAAELSVQGTSDETAAIEADLNTSDFESLDAELETIDAEFNAAQ